MNRPDSDLLTTLLFLAVLVLGVYLWRRFISNDAARLQRELEEERPKSEEEIALELIKDKVRHGVPICRDEVKLLFPDAVPLYSADQLDLMLQAEARTKHRVEAATNNPNPGRGTIQNAYPTLDDIMNLPQERPISDVQRAERQLSKRGGK